MNLMITHGQYSVLHWLLYTCCTYRNLLTHSHLVLHLKDLKKKYLGTVSRSFQLKDYEFGTQ